jgi:hypothetical protein
MAESGDPVGCSRGFGRVCLIWGDRVRIQFSDGFRDTYPVSECVFLDKTEKPSASVTVLAEYKRRRPQMVRV